MFQDGDLKPFLKSGPIPDSNNEPVKMIVADSLHDMVFSSGKNGLSLVSVSLLVPLVASFRLSVHGCQLKLQTRIFPGFSSGRSLYGFSETRLKTNDPYN